MPIISFAYMRDCAPWCDSCDRYSRLSQHSVSSPLLLLCTTPQARTEYGQEPEQKDDTLQGGGSRKRPIDETAVSPFYSSHRHGALGQLISVPKGGVAGRGDDRGSRLAAGLEEQGTNILREGAADNTDSRDSGAEYGRWSRAWPGGAITEHNPAQYPRRPALPYPPGSTPPTPPYRTPGPLATRDPLGSRTTEAGQMTGSSGSTEGPGRLARPPWTLPPLPPVTPVTQQARLPFPRGESDVSISRGLSVSRAASSDPEEKERSRSTRVTRHRGGGDFGDQDLDPINESRRRSPGDEVRHEGGSQGGGSGGSGRSPTST